MLREVWLSVPGYPRYSVSSLGEVYDHRLDLYVPQHPNRNGYLSVKLYPVEVSRGRNVDSRKTLRVHRLVADAFYDGDISDLEVNHVDGNKTNNTIVNLETCDRSYNMRHAFSHGLAKPVHPVQRVRIVETDEVFESTGQVDRHLCVSSGSVSKTLRGIQQTCKGYTFETIG